MEDLQDIDKRNDAVIDKAWDLIDDNTFDIIKNYCFEHFTRLKNSDIDVIDANIDEVYDFEDVDMSVDINDMTTKKHNTIILNYFDTQIILYWDDEVEETRLKAIISGLVELDFIETYEDDYCKLIDNLLYAEVKKTKKLEEIKEQSYQKGFSEGFDLSFNK